MSTSATNLGPFQKVIGSFPISEEGFLNLSEAPTADLLRLASAVLGIVSERRSEGATP